jgi:hypothetical protein
VIISSVRDRYFAPKVLGARSFLTAPAAGVPAAPPQNVQADNIADFVTLIISGGAAVSQDRIPIARNSSLRFAITNASGRDATFEILFYKVDPDPAKHVTISRGRVFIKNNEMTETPVYTFAENGQYRLIIKTNDNRRLIERTWRVVEL